MSVPLNPLWPVLTRYDRDHLHRIALPLGGIGTGTVSLGGRGDLRDWEVVNRPAKGFTPDRSFFMLYCRPEGDGQPVTRVLEGALPVEVYEGASGATARNHGLPRFHDAEFAAAYPFGQILLSDPDVPVAVRLEAFNPLVPADVDASGFPVALLRFVLLNDTDALVHASVCGNIENFVGTDGSGGTVSRNVNQFRVDDSGVVRGLALESRGVPREAEQWGTMALVTTAREGVSFRTNWRPPRWQCDLLDAWEDFADDGVLDDVPADEAGANENAPPRGSLAVAVDVPARGTAAVTFLLTWHFPNRRTWTPSSEAASCECSDGSCGDPDRIGNYYTTQFGDAWEAAVRFARRVRDLESRTALFVKSFCDSDLPAVVKEAALYNLSTLRTQTCFRTEDGRLYGWEGCQDRNGCCLGSCTHVWNYEQATAFLFGELACGMREVEFRFATGEDGHMDFRVHLPLDRAGRRRLAAADGQMGCLMKLYRDWQLSGDEAMLRALWPNAKRALEFCWVPGGWDADRDGVMEGCQHNTMDVEYYGPNPQMGLWYLGALRAAEEMALHLDDAEFAATCRDLFEKGRDWIDAHLFNGEYYEHEIRAVSDPAQIAEGLRSSMGADVTSEPIFQLGTGCLVDQLVGQFLAHVCGLGYLVDPEHMRTTYGSILRHNYRESLRGHANHMRSYALGGESGLLMASYPRGARPKYPFPYFTEIMTGFEYTAAVGMLYEGMVEEGLRCVQAIRSRYDGRKRSPFDEAECGHHYARAMASWAAVLALTGFRYSAVSRTMCFRSGSGLHFWSTGRAWGTCRVACADDGADVELSVLHGHVVLQRFVLTGLGEWSLGTETRIGDGARLSFRVGRDGGDG